MSNEVNGVYSAGSLAEVGERPATARWLAQEKLRTLSEAMEVGHEFVSSRDLLDLALGPWADQIPGSEPGWTNDLTDDGTPFEFSVTFARGRRHLRFLVEPQAARFTSRSTWEAGLALNAELHARALADLTLWDKVEPLFAPVGNVSARFLLWHGFVVDPKAGHTVKVYVNPELLGKRAARPLILAALARLGLPRAVEFTRTLIESGTPIVYLSLDLLPERVARVKVYAAYSGTHLSSQVGTATRGTQTPSEVALRQLRDLTGGLGWTGRPLLACYSFRGQEPRPVLTWHVPVRCLFANDGESLERASAFIPQCDQKRLGESVSALTGVPVSQSRGVITYVSLRHAENGPDVTVYLAPQVYTRREQNLGQLAASAASSVSPPQSSHIRELATPVAEQAPVTFADVQECVDRQQELLKLHEFYRLLADGDDVYYARLVASRIAFFVLAFQDVLRLAYATTTDSRLRGIAETHRREDADHDQWFLSDVERLGLACDARWLFSPEHELTRDVAYDQVACLLSSGSDHARLAVALCLESIGAVFFETMIGFLERIGCDEGLRYFARSHQSVEQAHDVFEAASRERLEAIEVPAEFVPEVWDVIDRTFAGMGRINDDLASLFRQPRDSIVIPRCARASDEESLASGTEGQ